jgi:hypothetical protein
MKMYDEQLRELTSFVSELSDLSDQTEDGLLQAVLDHSLRYVEQGKDLMDSYTRLLTAALYTVNTLNQMITRCHNLGAVEEFQNYRRLVRSFDYDTEDIMRSYERLRDIFERLLFASTYFGFCDYLIDSGPVKPTE